MKWAQLMVELSRHYFAESSALNAQLNQRAQEFVILALSLAAGAAEAVLVTIAYRVHLGALPLAASTVMLLLSLTPLFFAIKMAIKRSKARPISVNLGTTGLGDTA